ncbi:uncharacterized protein Dana_GF15636 [Drosophila ananassae]|uniref:Uncharacterized protein n=1 Tax=Drosophila ananassae TaxID=7217 RepID=B3MNE1_DROAN|nr:uncharacterized protein LOC6498442 [Drosophila ananassae]EDV32049.1 uncharacterized protein Dana_GF15636 [Drosophila ananassae]
MSDQEKDGRDLVSDETGSGTTDSPEDGSDVMPLTVIPSILRSPQSKTVMSGAPSITLTIPDSNHSIPNESAEERLRRRLRFLELRREHYNHMFNHTEVCHMASSDDPEDVETRRAHRDEDSM